MGVVVQPLVAADVAGVLFTRNPITGADELVIEASWGLGEAVVAGPRGPGPLPGRATARCCERRAGREGAWRFARLTDGGTAHEPVEPELVERAVPGRRAASGSVRSLRLRCEEVFGPGPHDIEWAFEAGALYLLQRRPVTGSTAAAVARG